VAFVVEKVALGVVFCEYYYFLCQFFFLLTAFHHRRYSLDTETLNNQLKKEKGKKTKK
jgi:hypothetical protein